jgi:hypothetical protein
MGGGILALILECCDLQWMSVGYEQLLEHWAHYGLESLFEIAHENSPANHAVKPIENQTGCCHNENLPAQNHAVMPFESLLLLHLQMVCGKNVQILELLLDSHRPWQMIGWPSFANHSSER